MTVVWNAARIESLRLGDALTWADLMETLAPRLMHYFEKLGVDHHLAEDVIQETFATVFRKLTELRDSERFLPWVNTIARNRLRSRLRVRRVFSEVEDTALTTPHDAASHLQDVETGALVQAEIARMPPLARRLVELRVIEGRAPAEVARILGMPRPLQRRRLHAALKTLRGRLRVRIQRAGGQIPNVS